jgi:hypothetical protein
MPAKVDQLAAPAGGLSRPSKMPGPSYSLPAGRCQIGGKLASCPGTVCSGCYAKKGCYMFASTVAAMARRMAAVDAALSDPVAADRWVDSLASALNHAHQLTQVQIDRTGRPGKADGRFFRWHDSGDLQSPDHLALICRVATETPQVRHWLPTRETGHVANYLAAGGTVPRNLRIRVSLSRVDGRPAPVHRKLATGPAKVTLSGVHTDRPRNRFRCCPAYQNDGHCGDCRRCWNRGGVSYPLH